MKGTGHNPRANQTMNRRTKSKLSFIALLLSFAVLLSSVALSHYCSCFAGCWSPSTYNCVYSNDTTPDYDPGSESFVFDMYIEQFVHNDGCPVLTKGVTLELCPGDWCSCCCSYITLDDFGMEEGSCQKDTGSGWNDCDGDEFTFSFSSFDPTSFTHTDFSNRGCSNDPDDTLRSKTHTTVTVTKTAQADPADYRIYFNATWDPDVYRSPVTSTDPGLYVRESYLDNTYISITVPSGSAENCTNDVDDDGDGLIDCQDSSECPSQCSGTCVDSSCSAVTYDWSCSADSSDCIGNCDQCSGSGNEYNCEADQSACTGNCDQCSGSGNEYNCEADQSACTGNCDTCSGSGTSYSCEADSSLCTGNCDICSGSGTSYSCLADDDLCTGDCDYCTGSGTTFSCSANQSDCSTCYDCSGSGTSYSCSAVSAGSDDGSCTGSDFCCSGSCVTDAPSDYGTGCGSDECAGTIQCNGADYECSTSGDSCAYCSSDTGYDSTCSQDGDCIGGSATDCPTCEQCIDSGSSFSCSNYGSVYDTTAPGQCLSDGTGCAGTSCICDGSGTCEPNAAEDCSDDLDNDGDGDIDCQDSDCPSTCSGNCVSSVCNPVDYDWECSADASSCTGNCDICSGSGDTYDCAPSEGLCSGDCSSCTEVTATQYNCQANQTQCSLCSDCSGSGTTFSCGTVADGSDDDSCSGDSFCCSGSCVGDSPADYGEPCGSSECSGSIQCNGADYECSTSGDSCAYCSGDTGYDSTCNQNGSCTGGSSTDCSRCSQCVDQGSSFSCSAYGATYDTTDPGQCLDDGTGCAGTACICDGSGSCVANADEDCDDNLDNDGDGDIDCQDSDCPTTCSGNCVDSTCDGVTYDWECSANAASCTGNCDQCNGSGNTYSCAPSPAMCTGDCDSCIPVTATRYDCAANQTLCTTCSQCSGSGTSFNCGDVADGTDDSGDCSGFCCSGNCVASAPAGYGEDCGSSECAGQVQCDGTDYRCSSMGSTCAYCSGDTGYTSTCARSGACTGGSSTACGVCDQCSDLGASVTCTSYGSGYDTTDPEQCLEDGTGCAGTSCICDGSTCIPNADENCSDNLDNDGDGFIDCQDTDCPSPCSGNCVRESCSDVTYDWVCSADSSSCVGDCDQCTGVGDAYNCEANQGLCSGDCALCSGSGTNYSCGADEASCSVCEDCMYGAGSYDCTDVTDGSDDDSCSGDDFCCGGTCMTTAPADFGEACGSEECSGVIQCNGASYECSTFGDSCAYCSGDTGFDSTCSQDGGCTGGNPTACSLCEACVDIGASFSCDDLGIGSYDTTDPNQCTSLGVGCAGDSCICDGSGSCIVNSENCNDDIDNDGDGDIDCQDSDCPHETLGNCENATCDPVTYDWEYSPDSTQCSGNCDSCTLSGGRYNCEANVLLCSGNCVECAGSGTEFNCQADSGACSGDCAVCTGSDLAFSCQSNESMCSECTDCIGSGTDFSCSAVADGSDDGLCSGTGFCCAGQCVQDAPSDYGEVCGDDESCTGTIQCDGTDYQCSTMGSVCAYCVNDTRYSSSCTRDGSCTGGASTTCSACDQCVDSGSTASCQDYAYGYDTTDPNQCLDDGTGCTGTACICDGSGNCVANADEDCDDNLDNDGDGDIDCQDSDCPSPCSGNCVDAVCNPTSYDWECSASQSMCTGNCDQCSGSGNTYNCGPVESLCSGDCSSCQGSGTSFSCQANQTNCSLCHDCVGSTLHFYCAQVSDGSDDDSCSGDSFCCAGNCVNDAPADHGAGCGASECSGSIQCDGTSYECSTSGDACAYCSGDTGYSSACNQDGDCTGGTGTGCSACTECVDMGSATTCEERGVGYDLTDPNQCTESGDGCLGDSCICDGMGACINNAFEDCSDNTDNDGDGDIDCEDSDCPTVCQGNCAGSTCNPVTYDWECSENNDACTGNCDQCSYDGSEYNCVANDALCSGDCAECSGSGTSFNCQADQSVCSLCYDCTGSSTTFTCSIVNNGMDDDSCSGDYFCCSGTCVSDAPADYGDSCGENECFGQVQCSGTSYRCSSMGLACAYCSGDTGYSSTCGQDGACTGGSGTECDRCSQCVDLGTSTVCSYYTNQTYDTTNPNQCSSLGIGCAGDSCICDGLGICVNNANEDCHDNADNDGDGLIDCLDPDCPHETLGNCEDASCNPISYDWEYSGNSTLCTGNCDVCSYDGSRYTCSAEEALCGGDCSTCSGSGTEFNCEADESSCNVCYGCSGSGTSFSCITVTDGLDDTDGCTGDSFCCNGACVSGALADHGEGCGTDESCMGTVQCDGTSYMCSTMGDPCAYCTGDISDSGSCNRDGGCTAETTIVCDVCDQCVDSGSVVSCDPYPYGQDTSDPQQCLLDGTGCTQQYGSCLCDGAGECVLIEDEECDDNVDNDRDGYIDCQDSDCVPAEVGTCEVRTCNNETYDWEYSPDPSLCTGNCDVCSESGGRYYCAPEASLCEGDCSTCSGSANEYNCAADESQCGACSVCNQADTLNFSCQDVYDGETDEDCGDGNFCCDATCVAEAPAEYGGVCYGYGQVVCNGSTWMCTVDAGAPCARCVQDYGYTGTIGQNGQCNATVLEVECSVCTKCVVDGASPKCEINSDGTLDRISPNICSDSGTGCSADSCVCNDKGICKINDESSCTDGVDNDGDGYIDCEDPDCPSPCTGDCSDEVCNSTTYEWDCKPNTDLCHGDCGQCMGSGNHYNCSGSSALCFGDCAQCVNVEDEFRCQADGSQCEPCTDCLGSGTRYNCYDVRDGLNDFGCDGDNFCCGGNCVTNAPVGFGDQCGDDESCMGLMECNGTGYSCSTTGEPCAYCNNDVGYMSECDVTGSCVGGFSSVCEICTECVDHGIHTSCEARNYWYDTYSPNLCTIDGEGCSGESCICYEGGCVSQEMPKDADTGSGSGGGAIGGSSGPFFSVKWNQTEAVEGATVTLIADLKQCVEENVTFTVMEVGMTSAGEVERQPEEAWLEGCSMVALWEAEYMEEGFLGLKSNPEYRFTVRTDDGFEADSKNVLTVDKGDLDGDGVPDISDCNDHDASTGKCTGCTYCSDYYGSRGECVPDVCNGSMNKTEVVEQIKEDLTLEFSQLQDVNYLEDMNLSPIIRNTGEYRIEDVKIVVIGPDGKVMEKNYPFLRADSYLDPDFGIKVPYTEYFAPLEYEIKIYSDLELIGQRTLELPVRKTNYLFDSEYHDDSLKVSVVINNHGNDRSPGYDLELSINRGRRTVYVDLVTLGKVEKDSIFLAELDYDVSDFRWGKYTIDWRLYRNGHAVTENEEKFTVK